MNKKLTSLLLVDPDRLHRKGLVTALFDFFMGIVHTSNTSEAIKFLQENECDVVLTEINFPFMDGIEFIKKLKLVKPESRIIIFTSDLSEENKNELRSIGVHFYLSKPIDLNNLFLILDDIIANINT